MNVLGVGAHYDDLELGCSGTLIKHVQKGDKVTMMVITDSSYKNPNGDLIRTADVAYREGLKAANIVGAELICLNYETFMVPFDEALTKEITRRIEELNIDTIYSHWICDLHRDHQYAAKNTLEHRKPAHQFKKFSPAVRYDTCCCVWGIMYWTFMEHCHEQEGNNRLHPRNQQRSQARVSGTVSRRRA